MCIRAICVLFFSVAAVVGCRVQQGQPDIIAWPPPLDGKLLVGTWTRENAAVQGVESHSLLVLNADQTWLQAEVRGPLKTPVGIEDKIIGTNWQILNPNGGRIWTSLRIQGGTDAAWEVKRVTRTELFLMGYGKNIANMFHYTKCDEELAKQLDLKLWPGK